ncbi:MAG TPA: hypothetical protein PLU52_11415 [Opitutaceae bacterium]|nr:hypothetical protein [Opitutaceae bacterium]
MTGLRAYLWIGSILLVVAALSASHYWAYSKGWTAADQTARIKALEGELASAVAEQAKLSAVIAQQDGMLHATRKVAADAAERERTAQQDLQELEDKFGEYVRQLGAQKPEDRCVLTPEDLARLATLVGKARAPLPASSREKGVPSPSPSKGPASAPPD